MIVTIDDASTMDMDDAISINKTQYKMTLNVYISDVTSIIGKDNDEYKRANERMETDYIRNIPMLPRRLSEYDLSLVVGRPRKVIAATFIFTRQQKMWRQVGECSFSRTEIMVDEKLTYGEADFHPILKGMKIAYYAWSDTNHMPYYCSPTYKQGKRVVLVANKERSRRYLTTIMKMTNIAAAKQIMKHGPAITVHRVEREDTRVFDDLLKAGGIARNCPYNKLYAKLYGKPLYMPILLNDPRNNRATYAIDETNCMVGCPYVQFTSPIRRFADIIAHIQLLGSLEGVRAFSDTELDDLVDQFNNYRRIKPDYSLSNQYLRENDFWGIPISSKWIYIKEINRVIRFNIGKDRRMLLFAYDGMWKMLSYN